MDTARFDTGSVILTEGEEGRNAYLITKGSVEVVIGQGDRARSVATLAAGDVFGEMSLLEPGPRSATVRALEPTDCVVTSYEDFMALIRSNPEQAIGFLQTLVGRLRKMNEMMEAMDPQRRSLIGAFRTWMASLDPDAENLTEEERARRLEAMTFMVPYF